MTTRATVPAQSITRRLVLTVAMVVVVVTAGVMLLSQNVSEKASPTHTLDQYSTAVHAGDGRAESGVSRAPMRWSRPGALSKC